jgi:heterodisulfide reductase subunit A
MKKTTPNVLILGGGVAGMAAARTLDGRDVLVHLVEKEKSLGGHAAKWSCMATHACENCGACLSIEAADQAPHQKNLKLHFNTLVQGIEKKDSGYEVVLENKESFTVQKIIMATGFSPFDPKKSPSLHYGDCPGVITTAELNTLLREESLSPLLKGKPDPKIAFIQCVGSRNREQGRDYCSQVCCKISMRHAHKLTHLYPEAQITLFYMDLQLIGKEIRTFYNGLSRTISLVQGLPAEILEHPETHQPTLVTEDKTTQSRVSQSFDLIVLSVGLEPSDTLEKTAKTLNLTPNSWGFFNTDTALVPQDIIPAGCAAGPKDILSSQQEGRIAAQKVMEDLDLNTGAKLPVAVFGEGPEADRAALTLASKGYPAYLFGKGASLSESSPVTLLKDSRLISVNGTAGRFSLRYESAGKTRQMECAAIVAAAQPLQSLNTLKGPAQKVFSLDEFEQVLEKTPDNCPENAVILLDYSGPEHKAPARLALTLALKARAAGRTISLIMNQMLVHGALGQRLYDEARRKGVDFFRYETRDDLQIEESGTGFRIKLKEATLPAILLDLSFNALVLPKSLAPAREFADLAGLLRQPLDKEGFLQWANTRHRPTQSLRKGIFFAGTGHDDTDPDDLTRELDEIASFLAAPNLTPPDPGVEINQKKCAQCLTCIRICPHGAIVMNDKSRPQIVPESCFSCHLCVSNCPAYAIESRTMANEQVADLIQKDRVTVFACERSAALAAGKLALPDHVTLIPIPCACRISTDILLKAILNGASKVIVSGCHSENCRSHEGDKTAGDSVQRVLALPGVARARVLWEPIAANEPRKFEHLLSTATE